MAAKYYVFNKEMDYKRGYIQNLRCCDDGLRPGAAEDAGSPAGAVGAADGAKLQAGAADGYGVFISRLLDGLEDGCIWHRLTLQLLGSHELPYRISIYASDSPTIFNGGRPEAINALILTPASKMDIADKKQLFMPYLMLETENGTDILLHQARGRYLWFMAELYGTDDSDWGIGSIMIYFPEQSWLTYLPSVYDRRDFGDTFLNRYLAIFQSLYDDLGRKIDRLPGYLDSEATDEETLGWLAGWLGIHHVKLWSGDQLRFLVSHAGQLFGRRGTKQGIEAFVRLYTGEQPLIVEPHQLRKFADNPQMYAPSSTRDVNANAWARRRATRYTLLEELYGSDPNVFIIIIRASCLPTAREFADLSRVIEDVKPAWMGFKLVTLRPYILLDSYSYLGINSVLSQYRPFELNGSSMLSFSTVDE